MSLGGFIRRSFYFINDYLRHKKGESMFSLMKDIETLNKMKVEDARVLINKRLQELLKHACTTTEFYKGYIGEKDLAKFPVINKTTIIDNRKAFSSRLFTGQKLHVMSTSGSTGVPFEIKQDKRKRRRVIAEIKAMSEASGYRSHEKMLYIMGGTKLRPVGKWQEIYENIYRIGVFVNDDNAMQTLVDFLHKERPIAIHASASNLPPLVSFIRKKELSPNYFSVKVIITGGEMVPDSLREDLESVFGSECKVSVKYSNEEMGILAQDQGMNTPYIINHADYYWEILEMDSDNPCAPGKVGRIVITDLFNYATPLIRYDTGDIGALKQCGPDQLPVLVELSGKRRDLIYDTKGNSISGAAMTNLFKHINRVRQWQFVQLDEKVYKLRVIIDPKNPPTEEDLLLNDIKSLLGIEADVSVEFVDELVTTNSGKTRYTVQLYKPC